MSVCDTWFKFSNFEKFILKYLKNFCQSSFRRPNKSVKSSCLTRNTLWIQYFRFLRFSSSERRQGPKTMITSSSQRFIRTTVKSGSSTLQKRRSVKLLDWQFGHFRLTRGLSRRTRHCRSMAGARHGMGELALRRTSTSITMAIFGAHYMHWRHEKCIQIFEWETGRKDYHSEYLSVGGVIILR